VGAGASSWFARARTLYKRHELLWHLGFFTAGFLFDLWAVGEGIDHPLIIVQQVLYLLVIGGILYVDVLREVRPGGWTLRPRLESLWAYRGLVLHFCLGTLMNVYSLFFLMSASFSSTIAFVIVLAGAIVLNELPAVQRRGVDAKIGLFVLCVFCFWSLLVPLAAGRVGGLTFVVSFGATLAIVWLFHRLLRRHAGAVDLRRRLLLPGLSVSACFLAFYLVGMIPPVPIAAKAFGVYHHVEIQGDEYVLSRARPRWRFWESGDQTFEAQPGDRIFVFVAVFSPSRFDDVVFVRWQYRDPRTGWTDADRLPLRITGGRRGGYRGWMAKQNYTDGDWRVRIETRDGRQIARLWVRVQRVPADPDRTFVLERY
jgi:hypothetical protein